MEIWLFKAAREELGLEIKYLELEDSLHLSHSIHELGIKKIDRSKVTWVRAPPDQWFSC